MSHYANLKVNMKTSNESDLVAALRDVFGADGVEVHSEPKMLKMYHGGNANIKSHIIVSKAAQGKALGREVLSNDLGFERMEDGSYKVHADAAGYTKAIQERVNMGYAEKVSTRELKNKGYMVVRKVMEDGKVKLVATKWS